MKELLSRFSLEAIKFDGQVLTCMILVWVTVVGSAISSINRQNYGLAQRRFWIAVVSLVPVFGVLWYIAVSFDADKYPELFFWRRSK